MPDTELEEKLRQIGEAGEQYANRQLIRHFLEEGYQIREENEHLCGLENEHTGQTAEVCRPDSNHYHQAGWDIAVRKTKKTEGESPSEEQTDYYEVKTCTMHSRYAICCGSPTNHFSNFSKIRIKIFILLIR